MRSNAHVAQTWLDAGCYLSFGARFNPAALLATPINRLLIETDDSDTPIDDVATLVAQTLHLTPAEVISHAIDNARQLLRY
jgi:TatD DNase family protein